jgi:hypothetical protein
MQPRNFPVVVPVPVELLPEADVLAPALVELLAPDELLPQAAISKVAAPAAMVAASAVRLTVVPPRN